MPVCNQPVSSAQLTGDLDDCFCDVESIDVFNNFKIFPQIKKLTEKDYFRYYRVRTSSVPIQTSVPTSDFCLSF